MGVQMRSGNTAGSAQRCRAESVRRLAPPSLAAYWLLPAARPTGAHGAAKLRGLLAAGSGRQQCVDFGHQGRGRRLGAVGAGHAAIGAHQELGCGGGATRVFCELGVIEPGRRQGNLAAGMQVPLVATLPHGNISTSCLAVVVQRGFDQRILGQLHTSAGAHQSSM